MGPKRARILALVHRKGSKNDPVGVTFFFLLVPFPPAAVLTSLAPQGVPRASFSMDLAYILTSFGYFVPHFFRFRTQGKNQIVEAENIV
jgi:hypothetical protein